MRSTSLRFQHNKQIDIGDNYSSDNQDDHLKYECDHDHVQYLVNIEEDEDEDEECLDEEVDLRSDH